MVNFSEVMTLAVLLFAIYGLTSTAGILSERSGIVNLSLNGYLMIGAIGSLVAHGFLNRGVLAQEGSLTIDLVSILFGALFAMVSSILFSIATINLKGDHVIVGTAMNMLLASIGFMIRFMDNNRAEPKFTNPGYSGAVMVHTVPSGFDYSTLIYLAIALVIMALLWFMIRYTKFGLRVWASGENPNALAAAGVNVYAIRWATQFIVAGLAGLGGGIFIVYTQGLYSGSVEGIGFIALAFIVLSQWRIHWAIPVSIVFAILQAWLQKAAFSFQTTNPGLNYVMEIIPFAIPIVLLPFFKKVSNAPKHDGLIYDKSKR